MNKRILHILLFVFATGFLHAQIPLDSGNEVFLNKLNEEVNLFTDRDLYLSGEEIWFSAFVLINNSFEKNDLSKILYLEIVDGKKKVIFKGKYEIEKGLASGSFQIPGECLSGNYFIRAYTLYQRNFSVEYYCTKLITVINPEFPLPKEVQDNDTSTISKVDLESQVQLPAKEVEVLVKTDKAVYGKRDPLELKIEMPDIDVGELAGLCVSVVRQGTLQRPEEFNSLSLNQEKSKHENLQQIFWIPETRGVSISGTVLEKNTQNPLANLNVYLSAIGESPQLHISQTKKNGAFIFSLGYISGSNELYLGVDPKDHKNIQITINNNYSTEFGQLHINPISIDTTYKTLLEEMLVNYQTQLVFSSHQEENSVITEKALKVFSNPEVSIRLADYIDLPNLQAIFYELVPTVKVREQDGKRLIRVFDPKTEIIFPNHLLLLDHVPVFDCDAALGLPPFRIDNIEVVNSTYYLGDNTFRNVVMLNSKAHDFAGYNFPEGSVFIDYQTLSPVKEFISPVYENQQDKNSRIPDFRTLLYWNSHIEISATDTVIPFYTSDNSGVYDIFVRGFTKNGKPCFGQGSITIQ